MGKTELFVTRKADKIEKTISVHTNPVNDAFSECKTPSCGSRIGSLSGCGLCFLYDLHSSLAMSLVNYATFMKLVMH